MLVITSLASYQLPSGEWRQKSKSKSMAIHHELEKQCLKFVLHIAFFKNNNNRSKYIGIVSDKFHFCTKPLLLVQLLKSAYENEESRFICKYFSTPFLYLNS